MTDPIATTARTAAQRLSGQHGSALTAHVEAALHSSDGVQRPRQYADPVSLGGLIVSIATLVWAVYSDLRKSTPNPDRDVVARQVRVRLDREPAAADLGPEDRDQVIDVVVDEAFNAVNGGSNGGTHV